MGEVTLPVDPSWAIGLVLAMTRAAAFALASPFFGRALPVPARITFGLAMAMAMSQPVTGVVTTGELVAAGALNAIVGAVLGYVTGLILHLFAMAGGILDLISGLSVSTVMDPTMGEQNAVFGRMFHLVGMTLFAIAGGLGLVVGALVASVRVLPLTGPLAVSEGLTGAVIELVTHTVRAGVELALPLMGVMLMLELALGLAARFAPQANVFLLGLPAKLFAAITVVGSAWVLFPDAMDLVRTTIGSSTEVVLTGLGGDV